MKIQMVIVANAREERGRSLVGILLHNAQPVMRLGQPHWLRPVMHHAKPSIPTPMVVDLMPLDIIELELHPSARLDDPDGIVEADFYNLQIKGRMPMEDLIACCNIPSTGDISENLETQPSPEEALGKAICMILACQCAVISPMLDPGHQQIMLQFGFNGFVFQYPVTDPQFLDLIALSQDRLVCKSSVQIVLSPSKRRHGQELGFKVLSVLL